MNEKQPEGMEYVPVTPEEAAKVGSPALAPEILDAKYEAPKPPEVKLEDIAKKQEILASLAQKPEQVTEIAPPINKIETPREDELDAKYPSIKGKNYADAMAILEAENSKHSFSGAEATVLSATTIGMGIIATQAPLIPAYIGGLLTGGGAGAVTTTGIFAAGIFGVLPIIAGTAAVGYAGYKLVRRVGEYVEKRSDEKKLKTAYGM